MTMTTTMHHQSRIQHPPLQYRNALTRALPRPETVIDRLRRPRHHRQMHHHHSYLRRGPVVEHRTSRLCEIDLDNSGWRPWPTGLRTI